MIFYIFHAYQDFIRRSFVVTEFLHDVAIVVSESIVHWIINGMVLESVISAGVGIEKVVLFLANSTVLFLFDLLE